MPALTALEKLMTTPAAANPSPADPWVRLRRYVESRPQEVQVAMWLDGDTASVQIVTEDGVCNGVGTNVGAALNEALTKAGL